MFTSRGAGSGDERGSTGNLRSLFRSIDAPPPGCRLPPASAWMLQALARHGQKRSMSIPLLREDARNPGPTNVYRQRIERRVYPRPDHVKGLLTVSDRNQRNSVRFPSLERAKLGLGILPMQTLFAVPWLSPSGRTLLIGLMSSLLWCPEFLLRGSPRLAGPRARGAAPTDGTAKARCE